MSKELIEQLRELSANRKPYATGAHGQMIGMESYRIVANGFALECIDEAAYRIEELEGANTLNRITLRLQKEKCDALQAEIDELVAALKPFGAIDLVESRLPAEFAMLILRARAAIAKVRKP